MRAATGITGSERAAGLPAALPPLGKPLTARERQAGEMAASGTRSREIADALGVAPATVRAHLRSAMEKTRSRSRAELAEWLAAQGGGPVNVPSRGRL